MLKKIHCFRKTKLKQEKKGMTFGVDFPDRIIKIMRKENKNPGYPQTGSSKLVRHHFFNSSEQDMDIPDGDLQFGKTLYQGMCAGCHDYIGYGPNLINIYGARGGCQKEFMKYSAKTKCLINYRWSKQRLFRMLQNPQQMFGLESAMLFDGIKDPYYRACIVEYIHFMRMTHKFKKLPKFYVYK